MRPKPVLLTLFLFAVLNRASAQDAAWYASIGISNYAETNTVFAPTRHTNFFNADMRTNMDIGLGRLYQFGRKKDMELQIGLGFFKRSASFDAEGVWSKASESYVAANLMFNLLLQSQQKAGLCGVLGIGLHVATNTRQVLAFADGRPSEKMSSSQGIYTKFAPKVQGGLRYAISPAFSVYGMIGATVETKALSITNQGQHNFFYYPVSVELGMTFSLSRKNKTTAE